ncbi:hypothetical protein [Methylocystis sp. SC2]|uniref:hypothetical protein n=1 Tax=Methylocystis sp. (strain SC2) TaxID=187303 RepID=UPI000300D671|nr:hypothetical protein [Methylocystis sp. SC2]
MPLSWQAADAMTKKVNQFGDMLVPLASDEVDLKIDGRLGDQRSIAEGDVLDDSIQTKKRNIARQGGI